MRQIRFSRPCGNADPEPRPLPLIVGTQRAEGAPWGWRLSGKKCLRRGEPPAAELAPQSPGQGFHWVVPADVQG